MGPRSGMGVIYLKFMFALLSTSCGRSASSGVSSARADDSSACGEVPIVSSDHMLGYYHETTLDYMRMALLEARVSELDDKLSQASLTQTVATVDELRGLDWCSRENQRKASLLINSLNSTLHWRWQHLDAMWAVTRRLIMGTLLQGLNQTSSGVILELQTAVDQVVQRMHQINLKRMAES